MTTGRFEALADSVFLAVRAYFNKEFAARLAPVEERIAKLPTIVKGEPGDPGAPGDAGPQGPQGPAGEKGIDGAVGSDGAAGVAGPQGAIGAAGDVGPQGERGDAGAAGERGEKGLDGLIGPQGTPGAVGERGIDGAPGARGIDGPQGIAGNDGAAGLRGDLGPQGEAGAPGASAFDLAKASGFVGSEVEWQLSLRGTNGTNGQDGRDGLVGERGERGRDAFEMEILDGIDPTRSYARGTAVVLNGGTWWAQRSTDVVAGGDYRAAGWLCILRGVASVTEELEDGGRVIIRATRFSDGVVSTERLKTAAMVHRGLFQAGKEYDAGDSVTYGGSCFVAQRATKQPPGDGDTAVWQLAVKRGKDRTAPA